MPTDFLALLLRCIEARSKLEQACIARSAPDQDARLYTALCEIASLAQAYPDVPLPMLEHIELLAPVLESGRQLDRVFVQLLEEEREREKTGAPLPAGDGATVPAERSRSGKFGPLPWHDDDWYWLCAAPDVDGLIAAEATSGTTREQGSAEASSQEMNRVADDPTGRGKVYAAYRVRAGACARVARTLMVNGGVLHPPAERPHWICRPPTPGAGT